MRLLKFSILLSICLSITVKGLAQENDYRFHKVFFYSFTKYIDWPQSQKNGDFKIGVMGDSEIIPLLNEMAEIKKVGGRNIKVIQIDEQVPESFYHILFVPASRNDDFQSIKSKVGNSPTLLITEAPGMATNGSMINFKDVNGKLRFEVNTTTLEQTGLKMSQELIRFGEEVK